MAEDLVLAGDIGGTKSNLGLFRGPPDRPTAVVERTYFNREFSSLTEVVQRFFVDVGQTAQRACFGVAGTVVDGVSTLPNLGWQISETVLAEAFGLTMVRLLNDLQANALGLATLEPTQRVTLNTGRSRPGGNRALIAAGTGLGMAILATLEGQEHVLPSEGGHMDFAPRDPLQTALLGHLTDRLGHVSVERLVSGQGLVNIYEFLQSRAKTTPDWLTRRLESNSDRAAVIAQAGLAKESSLCTESLELLLSIYGAVAGNLALVALATGGLYVGGGIAPRLIGALPGSGFMASFVDKGRFSGLLSEVPVHVVMEPRTALFGAARALLAS